MEPHAPAQNAREDQIVASQQIVAYEPTPVRGMHQDPLGAVGKSFWEDVIGALLPWEVEKTKSAALPDPSSYVGVGITFRRDLSGALLIHQIIQGGAASRTRMFLEHDELVSVDDEDVHKRPLSEVSRLILGPAGTMVSLTVFRRASGRTFRADVVRAENPVQMQQINHDEIIRAPIGRVNLAVPSIGNLTALHTVVMLASHGGESAIEEVAGLLVAGHDINARDTDGCTPIFFSSGSATTMQLLLNKRADVNITNRLGNTPLHYAAAANSLVCVEMLVRHGSDRSIRNAIGLTALQLAASLKKTDSAGFLRALDRRAERVQEFRPLPEKKMPLDRQLLFAIAEEGSVTDGVPVAMLLQAGADPNTREDATGMYALHLGIFQQSPATVRALLLAGAEQGYVQQGDDTMSPVACALIDRQITMTDTLDQKIYPPLVLRELIDGDCDVNAEIYIMESIMSPLHMAIMNKDFAAAELLIEEGADLNQMDKRGQTAEEVSKGGFLVTQEPSEMSTLFARRQGDTWPFRSSIAKVETRRHFCRPLRPLPEPLPDDQQELDIMLGHAAAEGDRYNIIKLCETGANVSINYTVQELAGPLRESTWMEGMDTPLNRACAKGSLRAVEIMVEGLGAKVDSTGMRSGFSPLHAAALGGNCNIVRYLLRHGAQASAAIVSGTGKTFSTDAATEPFVGYTPLMLAVLVKDPWSVNELLLAGASNTATGLDGKSPQDLFRDLLSTTGLDPVVTKLGWLLEPGEKGFARETDAGAKHMLQN